MTIMSIYCCIVSGVCQAMSTTYQSHSITTMEFWIIQHVQTIHHFHNIQQTYAKRLASPKGETTVERTAVFQTRRRCRPPNENMRKPVSATSGWQLWRELRCPLQKSKAAVETMRPQGAARPKPGIHVWGVVNSLEIQQRIFSITIHNITIYHSHNGHES